MLKVVQLCEETENPGVVQFYLGELYGIRIRSHKAVYKNKKKVMAFKGIWNQTIPRRFKEGTSSETFMRVRLNRGAWYISS